MKLKRLTVITALILLTMTVATTQIFAENVEGKVTEVNKETKTFILDGIELAAKDDIVMMKAKVNRKLNCSVTEENDKKVATECKIIRAAVD